MTPFASLAVAAIVLFAFPSEVFGPKGLRSLSGILGHFGHAVFCAAPGALWLWADPYASLQALSLTVGMTMLVGLGLLLSRVAVSATPAGRQPADAGRGGAIQGPISPWELQGIGAKATVTTPAPPAVRG
jgi:hypothetical protein